MNKTLRLTLSIVICLAAGAIGSFFTTPAINSWYVFLIKPSFSPPNWLFAPVWTTLYILMGIALFLVWQKAKENKKAIIFFSAQLILNSLWSILFFGLKSPGLALGEIVVLWLLILLTILQFKKISKSAAWLLLPYLLWVSFATFLNLAIFRLN